MNLSLILLDFLDDISFSKEIQTKKENRRFFFNKKSFGPQDFWELSDLKEVWLEYRITNILCFLT